MAELPADVRERLAHEYPRRHREAAEMLGRLGLGARVLRCVVFLAKGELDDLRRYCQLAREDWRDVIVQAEHDGKFEGPQLRSMSEPFSD